MDPYSLITKVCNDAPNFNVNQHFLIPVHNNFSPMKFTLYYVPNYIANASSYDKEVIATIDLTIPAIYQHPFDSQPVKVPLEIKPEFIRDMKSKNKIIAENVESPHLIVNIRIFSKTLSLIQPNLNDNIAEDRIKKEEFSISDIKLSIKRFKRMFLLLKSINDYKKMLFRFKYPALSYIGVIVLSLIILAFDPSYLISYLLLLVIIIFTINHPYINNLLCAAHFTPNTYSAENIKSKIDLERSYCVNYLFHSKTERKKVKESYGTKSRKKGVITSFLDARKGMYSAVFIISKICDYLEKLKK
jgi:hypothetical protein